MRDTLLAWLPADLNGARVLDAGCGTGAFAIEAARRGAQVLAIDLSPSLVDVARRRADELLGSGAERARIAFDSGDMSDLRLGDFDHVVAMDSLIHYEGADMARMIAGLAGRARRRVVLTFAPRTPLLVLMHLVGRLFPRADRAPAIVPIAPRDLLTRLTAEPTLVGWRADRTLRVKTAFYISQALELVKS
jgi:magnesium-protoporphyrin O-methyltransferase